MGDRAPLHIQETVKLPLTAFDCKQQPSFPLSSSSSSSHVCSRLNLSGQQDKGRLLVCRVSAVRLHVVSPVFMVALCVVSWVKRTPPRRTSPTPRPPLALPADNALNYAAILETAADVAKALLHLHRHQVRLGGGAHGSPENFHRKGAVDGGNTVA